jgi:hypothetical protein
VPAPVKIGNFHGCATRGPFCFRIRLLGSWQTGVTDRARMNKPSQPKPLADLVGRCLGNIFQAQGFASCEIVTHWETIVGAEIAARAEPIRMQWRRDPREVLPATLVLRVEGPAAIEIQHLSAVIIERVNRYLGWQAVGAIALRQAPLRQRRRAPERPRIDEARAAAIAAGMEGIDDDRLRAALGRLGAAVKPR